MTLNEIITVLRTSPNVVYIKPRNRVIYVVLKNTSQTAVDVLWHTLINAGFRWGNRRIMYLAVGEPIP